MTRLGARRHWLALVVLFGAGTATAGDVSFENDVLPLLTVRCVMCHMDGADQAHLSLYPDAWSHLVGIPSTQSPLKRVEAALPNKSYLYLKLMGTHLDAGGSGLRMPVQQDALGADELTLIRTWIAQGALQN